MEYMREADSNPSMLPWQEREFRREILSWLMIDVEHTVTVYVPNAMQHVHCLTGQSLLFSIYVVLVVSE